MLNNVEKFYEKKELYERFVQDKRECHDNFTEIIVGNTRVEIKINQRISGHLTGAQEEYLVSVIKKHVDGKQKDIEEAIMVQLAIDENTAAGKVITDLKLRDIVWIKQESD